MERRKMKKKEIFKDSSCCLHKGCESKHRADILEEPTEEELNNFFIIKK
jgi:hypothetical protein